MPIRSGRQFIAGLKARPREVWVQGERVEDVTDHPAFRASVEQLARLYDMQFEPQVQAALTYVVPETGERAGAAFMPATSRADLERRRTAYRLRAEASFGLMGRAPDFLSCMLLAFAEAKEVFARHGESIATYYRHVRDHDLFLAHASVTPQGGTLEVVRETDRGIVVRGARLRAISGPVSDEILIDTLPSGGADAVMFAVPTNIQGVRQICRTPYDLGRGSSFDHPLAARFEESDSVLVLDDVLVPWERVFLYRDAAVANAIHPDTALRHHTAHQAGTRALVKLQFAVGLAVALARASKADQSLQVRQMLGECLGHIELVKSALVRAEVEHETTAAGQVRAALPPLQALRGFLPVAYPRVIEVLQAIGADGFMMQPSSADFTRRELTADIARSYQGADGMAAVDRVALLKLAWDLCGAAFGARQVHHERYDAGDPARILAGNYLAGDLDEPLRLVEQAKHLLGDPSVVWPW